MSTLANKAPTVEHAGFTHLEEEAEDAFHTAGLCCRDACINVYVNMGLSLSIGPIAPEGAGAYTCDT